MFQNNPNLHTIDRYSYSTETLQQQSFDFIRAIWYALSDGNYRGKLPLMDETENIRLVVYVMAYKTRNQTNR